MRPKCYQTWNESQTEMLVSMKHSSQIKVTVKIPSGQTVTMDEVIGTYEHVNIERSIKAATSGIITWASEGDQITIPESNRFERLCIISVNGIKQSEKKQIQITLRELNPLAHNIDKWRISLNENLYVNEIVGFASDLELSVKIRGAVEKLAVPGDYNPDDVVLELSSLPDCRHLRVEQGRCVYCKEQIQVKQEEHCFPGWHMDESMARRYSLEVIRYTILTKRKLIMVLDLDQTILHAIKILKEFDSLAYINKTNAEIPPEDHNTFTNLGFNIPEALLEMNIDRSFKFIIKLRPYFQQFFMRTIPIYEFYIYTKASRGYAEFILGFLTQNLKEYLPDEFPFFPNNRIFSREDTSVQNAKSLNRLFFPGVADNLMIILDDNASMWTQFKDNLIHTRPYTYFKEGTNKDAQGISLDVEDKIIVNNRYDFWLLAITEQLVKISKIFWESVNDAKQDYREPVHVDPEFPLKKLKVDPPPDDLTLLCNKGISVKKIYANLRSEILKDVKLFFCISQSHTAKQIQELESAKALAIKLGGKITTLDGSDMLITIGRKKVRSIADANSQKIPIVSVHWVFDCDAYMRNLPIEHYTSEQDLSEESRDKFLKSFMFKN